MGTITELRPSSTSSGVGWTPSTGTLHGVTSDDSDATYATWGGDGSALILATPADAPPVGERRHQVRLRARGEDGSAWWSVRLSSGTLVAGATAIFPASPATVIGSWGFGAPPDGSTVLYTYVTGQLTGVRITELYLDVDSREAPTFSPQILDGSGSPSVTISDTAQPVIRADDIELDDLAARQYRYWVTLNGAVVWDTEVVSGAAVNRQTAPLDNGDYVAHLQIWSTLGQNTPYPSAEETLEFTVQVGQVAQPDNPTVEPVDGTPFYEIEACAPYVDDLDGDVGWIEVQRVDCPVGGYLTSPGSLGAYASTPDPGSSPVDLEVIVKAGREDGWLPPNEQTIAAQYEINSDNRAWRLMLSETGQLALLWSLDGTLATVEEASSSEPVGADPFGNSWVRARMVSDNGSGVWAVTFATRETEDSSWVQLGEEILGSAPGPMFDSTAAYTVGAYLGDTTTFAMWDGRVYSVEVRDAPDGVLIVGPDFTSHLSGTAEFTDGLGNPWTVHSPASIYSPTSTVTVAMLGPLETGQCATWTDFTIPRTGASSVCEHTPDPCCSYYRARTVGRVDGDLRISDWSDAFDPGIPAGIIVMWPDTNASIPEGWDRTTALDSRYPKGVPDGTTDPGTTGGSATHSHTTPGHTHDTSHIHTTGANTATATGTVNAPNTAGALKVLTSHTHTRPAANSATVASGSTSPGTDTIGNDPDRLDVIFMESDGTPLGVPDGALALMPDISVSGWTDYANATNRFLKGAAPAGNGGSTVAGTLASHSHSVAAHTHTGTAHAHTSSNTGNTSSTLAPAAGSGSVISAANHNHPISISSGSTASLSSAAGGSSGTSGALDPPYRNLRARENTSGDVDLPVGLICAWRGPLGRVPDHWQLCDGTNGTPDMFGLYPRGATAGIGTTGGSLTPHSHTGPSHSHSTSGHSHTAITGPSSATTSTASTTATVAIATGTHTHTTTDTDSTSPTVASVSTGTLADADGEPAYEEVAFIQLMEEPGPPPDPDVFCLTWDPDEHLVRSTGPDGPIWAPVLGRFEWSVSRPFTSANGVNGGRFVTSAPPGGRDLSMVAAVESEADLNTLRAVLARPLVLISPSDAEEVWAAPVQESVRIVKIGRIRQVSASFIGTGPQPPPQLADVGI